MSKKSIIGGIILAAIIGVVFVGAQINPDNPENINVIFHVTLADPTLYEKGVFVEEFQIEEGAYEFGFVPNGDSPQKLSIKLFAESGVVIMDNHFELEGTLIDDGISSWYTWDYLGEKRINFDESQWMKINVDPNGETDSSVSVGLYSIK